MEPHRRIEHGREQFFFTLDHSVPVEAMVIVKDSKFPEHVLQNSTGYGFVMGSSSEAAVTFLDYLPRAWLTTGLEPLQKLACH